MAGGKVTLTEGGYNIVASVSLDKANSVLEGQGRSTVLEAIAGSTHDIVELKASHTTACHLKCKGNKWTTTGAATWVIGDGTTYSQGSAIAYPEAGYTDINVEHIMVENYGTGIVIRGYTISRLNVDDVYLKDTGVGFMMNGSTLSEYTNLNRVRLLNHYDDGIDFNGGVGAQAALINRGINISNVIDDANSYQGACLKLDAYGGYLSGVNVSNLYSRNAVNGIWVIGSAARDPIGLDFSNIILLPAITSGVGGAPQGFRADINADADIAIRVNNFFFEGAANLICLENADDCHFTDGWLYVNDAADRDNIRMVSSERAIFTRVRSRSDSGAGNEIQADANSEAKFNGCDFEDDTTFSIAGTATFKDCVGHVASGDVVSITLAIDHASLTDGTDATAYMDFTQTIPAGSIIKSVKCDFTEAFNSDDTSTLTMMIGPQADLDAYNLTADPGEDAFNHTTDVFWGESDCQAHIQTAAAAPRVTFTEDDDGTDIINSTNAAGAVTITITYMKA